jgi:hypothetical protein
MWSQNEAVELFQKHGFRQIKIVNYNVILFHYPFNKIISKICSAFGVLIERSFLGKISLQSTSFIIFAVKK